MTGNQVHDATVRASYGALQAAVAGATTQVAVNTAYLTHYRTCLASAIANKCGTEPFTAALKSIGVNS
jgi:hypothetical protein